MTVTSIAIDSKGLGISALIVGVFFLIKRQNGQCKVKSFLFQNGFETMGTYSAFLEETYDVNGKFTCQDSYQRETV